MKIVIFGCQQICVDFIRFLRTQADVEVPLIVTSEQPRDASYGYPSVREEGRAHGLRVEQWPLLSEGALAEIEGLQPDAIFSVYARQIFPTRLLTIPKLGTFNVHPSLLPEYRGPSPSAWAMLNGERTTGVTIHVVDGGIDTGDVLVQAELPIGDDETGFELHSRLMTAGAGLLSESFRPIVTGQLAPRKQVGPGSYFGKLANRGRIDWQTRTDAIRNVIRVHAPPFDAAHSAAGDRTIRIKRASAVRDLALPLQGPGKIVAVSGGQPIVSCADGFLRLEDYDLMPPPDTSDRGRDLSVGDRLS